MAGFADFAAHDGHGHHPPLFEQLLVAREHAAVDVPALAILLGLQPGDFGFELPRFGRQRGAAGLGRALCRRQLALGGRQLGRQAIGGLHREQNLLLDAILLGLERGDLVQERGVLLVGLDRGLVLVEAREARLDRGQLRFELPAGGLVPGAPFVDGGDDGLGGRHTLVELALGHRELFEPAPSALGGRVEGLERHERSKRGIHSSVSVSRRTGRIQPVRSGQG